MRRTEIIAGALLLLFSILGYQHSSLLVNDTQNTIINSMKGLFPSSLTSSQLLPPLRYQDSITLNTIVQSGCLLLAVVGIVFLLVGIGTKRSSPKEFGNISLKINGKNPEVPKDENTKANYVGIRILKERLARGEITQKEFENLKRFFE